MTQFGDFEPLCRTVPSYPWCNLFFRQLQRTGNLPTNESWADPNSAGVGINPKCFIPPTFTDDPAAATPHLGNIAQILACVVSLVITALLVLLAHRRRAAVGRVEFRSLLMAYALTLPFNAITTGAFLQEGGQPLTIITAIHAGLVVAFFWLLLANALIATQVVEDGTMSSLVPYFGFGVVVFGATVYISLDVALGITDVIGKPANPPTDLKSIALFVLLIIWPLFCLVAFFGLMTYIVLAMLQERRPMIYYTIAAIIFALSQLAWLLLGKVLCDASKSRVDGIFLATVLETVSVIVLFLGWRSITEESWEDSPYSYPT
jgi:hypothetical protein